MVKSNEIFSKNYKQSEKTEGVIEEEFKKNGFDVMKFDIESEFEKCNNNCPIQVEHFGQMIPYARWILYGQISRPDMVVRLNKPILIEIKHKNKKYIWINSRDYLDYLKWEKILLIPIYIIIYVKDEDVYYIHRLESETKKLKSLITKHDKNEVFDVEDRSLRVENVKNLLDFFKKKSS